MMHSVQRTAWLVAIVVVGSLVCAQGTEPFENADQAVEWLVEQSNRHEDRPETVEAARGLIRAEADEHPGEARWAFGLGLAEARSGDWSGAKPLFVRAAELDATVAEYHYWIGNAVYSTIDEVGLLGKGAAAGKGRDAYLKAIELDPAHAGARIGLCEFYMHAPGIAGGSRKKAREHAAVLLELEGYVCHGHRVLGTIHAEEGDWEDAAREFELAIETAKPGEERRGISMAWISITLDKNKHDLAVDAARELLEIQPDDPRNEYALGAVLQEAERHEESVGHLERGRDGLPDAASPLWRLAVACEELDRYAEAYEAYSGFAERFPDDDRVKTAKKKAKRMKRKMP